LREHQDEVEYEEWIYGEPPQDVDFVRFVGEEVARVETMKVGGQKEIRTDREVDLPAAVVAEKPQERPVNAPTLRRPGEDMPDARPAGSVNGTPPISGPPPVDSGGKTGPI
jgi:hypothetical protein